jgi:hypothetical protein
MTGHLARLCLEGAGSTGRYTPHGFDLRLLGTEQAADHIVYLHEVHHAALNDVTAWGSALHVYARLPGGEPVFAQLLDACCAVHETLATFASVQIAAARHGELNKVLAAYPRYVPLYDAADRLTKGVAGGNRRQQVATALARVCMQTPVLDTVIAAGPDRFRIAAIRERDRPDGRWNWFLRCGPELVAAAARAADRVITAEYGPKALQSDGPGGDLYTATDRSHDAAWDRWEATAYEHLRAALADVGAATLTFSGHQDGTARLLELARERYGDLGLRAAMTEEQARDDAQVASAVLQQVRHNLTGGERHRAICVPSMGVDDVISLLGDRPVVDGRPAMIVDARPADRLADLYDWAPGSDAPPVAVRLMVEDDDGPAVGHVPLTQPAMLTALADRWGERGAFVLCVSASCLAEPGFADRWLATVPRPVFVLVDVEPERFVPRWAAGGRTVVAVPLQVDDTAGRRSALLFTADDGHVWWLVVADDVTVRLMIEYLRGCLGSSLRIDQEAFGVIREPALVAITHILATESFTSFDARGSARAR